MLAGLEGMNARTVALVLLAWSCGSPKPQTCTAPTERACHPAAAGGQLTPEQLRADCSAGEACVSDGADGGFCMADTFSRATQADGGQVVLRFAGTCSGCGTCRFSCGGFAGFSCPSACVADGPAPPCCDQISTCTVRR